jgi:DMSO/TMAO reductase YedYZ molybdopterin-dependent catalytic subunit/thiosulfate reductase cytochrome b subunit
MSARRHLTIVRITHWLVVLSVTGLLATGIGILVSHPRLYWGETGAREAPSLMDLPIPFIIGPSVWNRPFHFFFAWILVLTGLTYVAGSVLTRHFQRDLLPAKADLRWNHITRVISDHLRWKRPSADAAWSYNAVQRLTYLGVVFVIFPGIVWTGLGMSFGITSVFPILATAIGGHQSARTLHFVFVVLLLLFVVVHVTMLVLAGFWRNVRAMITGYLPHGNEKRKSELLVRRRFITAGLATAASASGLGAAVYFADRYGLIPPDHNGIIGIGETLTYATQRLVTSEHSLAREFKRSDISQVAPVNGPHPVDEKYQALLTDGFKDWRLSIEGLVARPVSLSLDDLKRLTAESHILLHACEEGWSYIAEWTGVRLATVLDLAGLRPEARYVVFEPFANPNQARTVVRVLWETIDMADARHPQTMLAYGMNGEALPADHGAPIRLRMGRHLGYKNTKYLSRIVVTNDRDYYRKGRGTWYGGI